MIKIVNQPNQTLAISPNSKSIIVGGLDGRISQWQLDTKQYEVNGLKGMLLSPRSRRYCNGYATCTVCNSGMQASMASKKTPPKFAIANGFVIGSFPRVIQFINKEDEVVKRKIEEYELTDIVKAMAAPIRPYGCVFAYSGGAQKSLRGNYQFFEMDHNRLNSNEMYLIT